MIKALISIFILSSCTHASNNIGQKQILGSDYRLFKNTPAWELAEAVEKEDTVAIGNILKKNRHLVDYKDPISGQTLLMLAVYNRNYNSANKLLKLGANPNIQSSKEKKSALMVAASLGGGGKLHPYSDARFLKLLLKYKANPNDMQQGDRVNKRDWNYLTPLEFACLSAVPEYVKLLVDAGANVNLISKDGFSPLFASVVSRNPDIVLYLLKKGANYNIPMFTTIQGEKKYILDVIDNMWHFDQNSDDFKKEITIRDFIRSHK